MKIIASGKTPLKIKSSTMQSFIVIMKNINFKKYFLTTSPMSQIKHVVNLAIEGCSYQHADPSETKDESILPSDSVDPSLELYQVSLRFLINLLCLP